MSSHRRHAAVLLTLAAGACASRPEPPVVVLAPPPPLEAAPMPAGGRPGMVIPAALPDGRYPTPSIALTPAAATWHLRAALNVAVLACRGADEAVMAAQYNQMLAAQRTPLAAAEQALAREYAAATPAGRAAYDSAMTRLYNFYAQDMARPAFCEAARGVLAQAAAVPAAELPAFATTQLAALDRPFTDFYAAYDRWRAGAVTPAVQVARAPAAPTTAAAMAAAAPAAAAATTATPPAPPRITVDVAGLN